MKKLLTIIFALAILYTCAFLTCHATDKFVKILAEKNTSYAMKEDGTIWTWGENFGNDNILLPREEKDLSSDIFLTDDGLNKKYYFVSNTSFYCKYHILDYENYRGDIEISMPKDLIKVQIAVAQGDIGGIGGFGLRNDGVFGSISAEKLEDGTVSVSFVPTENMTDIKDFDIGTRFETSYGSSGTPYPYQFFTLILLKNDGTVWRYFYNDRQEDIYFTQVEGLKDIQAISQGEDHALALDKNGDIWAWGNNDYGQLGIGMEERIKYPVNVACIKDAVKVAANNNGYMGVVRKDGTFSGWKIDAFKYKVPLFFNENELYNSNETVVKSIPGYSSMKIDADSGEAITGISAIRAIAYTHAKLKSDGTVWLNDTIVEGLTDVIDIKAAEETIYALKSDGTVWEIHTPKICTQLENLTDIKKIACGVDNILAVRNDGSVIKYYVGNERVVEYPLLNGAISIDGSYFYYSFNPKLRSSYYCILMPDGNVWIFDDDVGILDIPNYDKPCKVRTSKAMYRINSPVMVYNGETSEIDAGRGVTPFLLNDRTYIPIRNLTEKFGGEVSWNEALQEVTIAYNSKEIKLYINKNVIIVNGEELELDSPPVIENERTFVPLRVVMEIMGFSVQWENSTYGIFID